MAARGHHAISYARADHLIAAGPEGEVRCSMKMIGAKTGKFGQKDEIRTVGMATAPKLKSLLSDIFFGDQPFVGKNIHKSGCCV
jgi:hypothetical protein